MSYYNLTVLESLLVWVYLRMPLSRVTESEQKGTTAFPATKYR